MCAVTAAPGSAPEQVHHLRSGGVSVVVAVGTSPGLPRILYWGADLGALTDEALRGVAVASVAQVTSYVMDEPVPAAVLPEHALGYSGWPGVSGHRDGRDWSPLFTVTAAARVGDEHSAALVVQGADETAALGGDPAGADALRAGSRPSEPDEHAYLRALPRRRRPPHPARASGRGRGARPRRSAHPRAGAAAAAVPRRHPAAREPTRSRRPRRLRCCSSRARAGSASGRGRCGGTRRLERQPPGVRGAPPDRRSRRPRWRRAAAARRGEPWRRARRTRARGSSAPTVRPASTSCPDASTTSSARVPPIRARRDPVILNTWEAVYFDADAATLRRSPTVPRGGRDRAVRPRRRLVPGRRSEAAGLGDWFVDADVWPDGLGPLVDHVRGLGMQFGLWVEPESVNPDSDLARAHPDWILATGGRLPPLSRLQHVLDLGTRRLGVPPRAPRRAAHGVRDRVPQVGPQPRHRRRRPARGEAGRPPPHRGPVRAARRAPPPAPGRRDRVCAGGGGRIDLEILERTDRVWTSDSNDPLERQQIQRWTGLLVPPELLGAHVGAAHAHTTHRTHTLAFAAGTALFGHFGMELDLTTMSPRSSPSWRSGSLSPRRSVRSCTPEGRSAATIPTPPCGCTASWLRRGGAVRAGDHADRPDPAAGPGPATGPGP